MIIFQKGILYENHEVLTPGPFKTRAKNKAKNTKEFCKITSLIAVVGHREDSQNGHPESVNLSIFASPIWTSGLEPEFPQNLETRDHARDST